MKKVSKKIFTRTDFHGCNPSFIVTEEGIILIDTPYLPTDALKWREEIKGYGGIRYIINTEHHPDHVLGNFFFEGAVISHYGTKENFGAKLDKMGEVLGRIRELDPEGVHLFEGGYSPNEPQIVFDNKLTLYMGNQIFELMHLPGHTPNQIAILVAKERVLFTGDNVVYRTRPFYHECKPKEWIKSLEYLKTMDFDVLIPGHGEVCTKKAIDEMILYHNELFEQIERAIKQGLGKEETIKKVRFDERMPLMDYQKKIGRKMDQMGIHRIYEELSNKLI